MSASLKKNGSYSNGNNKGPILAIKHLMELLIYPLLSLRPICLIKACQGLQKDMRLFKFRSYFLFRFVWLVVLQKFKQDINWLFWERCLAKNWVTLFLGKSQINILTAIFSRKSASPHLKMKHTFFILITRLVRGLVNGWGRIVGKIVGKIEINFPPFFALLQCSGFDSFFTSNY